MVMENNDELFLVYVNPVGKNSLEWYEYEFFFSKTPENIWAEDWAEPCPSVCDNVIPNEDIDCIRRLKTNIKLSCAQENSCFSMQDCVDGILSIVHEDISELDTYPEPYRIVFKYGESYKTVEEKLAGRHQLFEED